MKSEPPHPCPIVGEFVGTLAGESDDPIDDSSSGGDGCVGEFVGVEFGEKEGESEGWNDGNRCGGGTDGAVDVVSDGFEVEGKYVSTGVGSFEGESSVETLLMQSS